VATAAGAWVGGGAVTAAAAGSAGGDVVAVAAGGVSADVAGSGEAGAVGDVSGSAFGVRVQLALMLISANRLRSSSACENGAKLKLVSL